jgi:hypothetical protein
MKSLVVVLCTACCVYALASAWSDIVQPQLDAAKKANESLNATSSRRTAQRSNRSSTPAEDADEEAEPTPRSKTKTKRTSVASRIEEPLDETSYDRLTQAEVEAELKKQAEEVKRQEARLVSRQESLRLIYDDIREELTAVENIRQRAAQELADAEQNIIPVARNEILPTPAELAVPHSSSTRAPKPASLTSLPVESVARDSQSMRAAALMIRRLVTQGSRNTAISLLSKMKAREATKVLTALHQEDAALATDISRSLQAMKQASHESDSSHSPR